MNRLSERHIVIGTRGSDLALWQAEYTRNILERAGFTTERKIIKTQGDKIQDLSFDKMEGKGFFTKEIEDALLNDEIDLAVHSCKDLSTEDTPGLHVAAYSIRANSGDWLLVNPDSYDPSQLLSLKKGATVGTSAARRKAQLLSFREDVVVNDLRGNVPTRVAKLRNGEYDAIILAAAGLERLNLDLSGLVRVSLQPPLFIPAPAQGVLAWQIRKGDSLALAAAHILGDDQSNINSHIERGFLAAFQGGCQVPIGIYSTHAPQHNKHNVWISWAKQWNSPVKRVFFTIERPYDSAVLVHKFLKMKPCSVFISRENNADSFFHLLQEMKFEVAAESFLEFTPVSFSLPAAFSWIFFASKNGVDHFLSQSHIPGGVKIAAINQGTARHILGYGYAVDFEGEGRDLEQIAGLFKIAATDEIVLFPQARNSRKTIQGGLARKQVLNLVVYEDEPKQDIGLRKENIIVFTSPLNVNAYFSKYSLKKHQHLVAIGTSTAKAIQAAGYSCRVAYEPTPWCMADEVMSIAAGL